MQGWIGCVSAHARPSGAYHDLLHAIYIVGEDSLFSLEILRQHRDTKSRNALFDILEKIIQASPIVIGIVPRIFASFVQRIRRYRSTLYVSSQVTSTEELRMDGMNFFALCHNLLGKITQCDDVWSARLALLAIVEKNDLFTATQSEAEHSLKNLAEIATAALDTSWEGAPLCLCFRSQETDMYLYAAFRMPSTTLAIDVLSSLSRIDYTLIVEMIPKVLPRLLLVRYATEIYRCIRCYTKLTEGFR